MSDLPSLAVSSLGHAGLFEFEDEAIDEIRSFFERPGAEYISVAMTLSVLNAAEFSLIPFMTSSEETELPPSGKPILVGVPDARLSLLKGDCSLIHWTHSPQGKPGPYDISVFSGDVSKVVHLSPKDSAEGADMVDSIELIETAYRESGWRFANRVLEAGLLRIQLLLWNLKKDALLGGESADLEKDISDFF